MQNKINQKVPIAKMDELIAAIKESGGGIEIYRHDVSVVFTTSGQEGTGKIIIYNQSPDVITSLAPYDVAHSLSVIYPRIYIYNSFFDIIQIASSGYAIGFQEKADYSVTYSQLTFVINKDDVTKL